MLGECRLYRNPNAFLQVQLRAFHASKARTGVAVSAVVKSATDARSRYCLRGNRLPLRGHFLGGGWISRFSSIKSTSRSDVRRMARLFRGVRRMFLIGPIFPKICIIEFARRFRGKPVEIIYGGIIDNW